MTKKVIEVEGLPPFERSTGPWFGPTKRARFVLENRRRLWEPIDTLRFMQATQPSTFGSIQHVRFIDSFRTDLGFRFTIALCWMNDDPAARDALYHDADNLVEHTGWYPIPQGSRLGSVQKFDRRDAQHGLLTLGITGRLRSVTSAVPPEGGCAVRVSFDDGTTLLLDTGLPGALETVPSDRLALISHVHADHTGGLVGNRVDGLPKLMSSGTRYLLAARSNPACLNDLVTVEPGDSIFIGDHVRVDVFAVPHLPGAVGYVLSDDAVALAFTGDVCLRTRRHDFIPALSERLHQYSQHTTLLLDATMAGRAFGASDADPTEPAYAHEADDLVVVADAAEHLLYAYLDLFHRMQRSELRHSRSFLVTGRLRPMFQMLHQAFITRSFHRLDPFLLGQYGKSMTAWGESRWLFWLDRLKQVPHGRRVWILTRQDLTRCSAGPGSGFIRLGRDQDVSIGAERGWTTLPTDTTPWTLHTGESSLIEGVRALTEAGVSVALFHNFGKRLQSFVRRHDLDAAVLSHKAQLSLT